MSGAVRGWCPGALRPMASGDGYVLRVRPRAGHLSPEQVAGLGAAAEAFGNGEIALTRRANLQIRGVAEDALAPLRARLAALDLLDIDPAVEARRNLVSDPFGGSETRALSKALEVALAEAEDLAPLPSKFGFALDPGPSRMLSGISGDIRIEGSAEGGLLVRAEGAPTGRTVSDAPAAIRAALELARWFLASGGVGPDGRGRMARHLESGAALLPELAGDAEPAPEAPRPEPGDTAGGALLAAAFGRFPASSFAALPEGPLAITPWRMVFTPGRSAADCATLPGLITTPDDPLLRVEACPGAPACPQGEMPTEDTARRLAARLPTHKSLHVSGCAKGCAGSGSADLTLTGRAGRFDLVQGGAAWDEPFRRGLAPDDLTDLWDD
ncbi:hypothetical protein LR948_05470 [Roseivivax sp. GX 12232]|uniref:hypothetical protein n=1 Tax=Roseivivax sp. GX 12232 TaxID=2900547 RepID=UPI001E4864D5|nr:hypothetical protein [Roseivivax sp. GX 12232]MCE0504791.1 hypothetical protein [Roseivivax sp. GX 12232]